MGSHDVMGELLYPGVGKSTTEQYVVSCAFVTMLLKWVQRTARLELELEVLLFIEASVTRRMLIVCLGKFSPSS